jgi:acyl carrier protein
MNLARGDPEIDVDHASLVDSGIIDSLGILKLVDFVERELGVRISDEELLPENFDSLDAIERLVSTKLVRAGSGHASP